MQSTFIQKMRAIQDEFQTALRLLSRERQSKAESFRKEAEKIKIEEIKQSIRSL